MGFFVALQPPTSPSKQPKFVGENGEARRLSMSSTLSPTVRCEDASVASLSHHSIREKLSIDSLEVDPLLPTVPHQFKDEPVRATSPRKQRRSVAKKTPPSRTFGRDVSTKRPTPIVLDRRCKTTSDTSLEFLGQARPSLPRDHSMRSEMSKGAANGEDLQQQSHIVPSSPSRAIARNLSWSKMVDASIQEQQINVPSSPLQKIARQISWSNMASEAFALPIESSVSSPHPSPARKIMKPSKRRASTMQIPDMETNSVRVRDKTPASPSKRRASTMQIESDKGPASPFKHMVKRISLRRMGSLNAPMLGESLDEETSSTAKHSPRKKQLSLRNMMTSSDASEHPRSSPMRTIAKKLSLRSLCGGSSRALDNEDENAQCNPQKRTTLTKHLSLNRFDNTSTLQDENESVTERSTASTARRSLSPMRSLLRKSSSLRSGCFGETAAVDTSTPEAAAAVRASSPRRKLQKQESDGHIVRSSSPRRSMRKQTSAHEIGSPHKAPQVAPNSPKKKRSSISSSPSKSRRASLRKQSSESSSQQHQQRQRQWTASAPESPVKKKPSQDKLTAPPSPRRASIKAQSKVLATPTSPRKKFVSLADCIGAYENIIDTGLGDSQSVTDW